MRIRKIILFAAFGFLSVVPLPVFAAPLVGGEVTAEKCVAAAIAAGVGTGNIEIRCGFTGEQINKIPSGLGKKIDGLIEDIRNQYQSEYQIKERQLQLADQQEEDIPTAIFLNKLAVAYQNQGRYAEAESLYKQAIEIGEKTLGGDHPEYGKWLNNLAGLYQAQGRYGEAEPLFQRALKIFEASLGNDHPDIATAFNNLAGLYRAQGRYAQAEPLYKRAIAIGEKTLGKEHPSLAARYNNLALLYRAQGRYAQAAPLYDKALAILEKALGPDHPNTVMVRENREEFLRRKSGG